jgi:hypothetical protein
MRSMAGVPSRVAALAVAATAAALLTAGCSSLSTSLKQVGAGAHSAPAKTYTVTARVTSLTLNTAGSVTVSGTAGSGPVTVTETTSYSKIPPVTTHNVSGSALTLAYTCKPQLLCSVSYDIKVPHGTAVHAEGREGSVTLTSLSGPVSAQTVTGLISATGLTSPSAVLKSGAGGINATFAAPPASVQASTKAGAITIAVPGSAIYQVSAHAVIGVTTVSVHHAATAPHVITAHSDLGSITISPS